MIELMVAIGILIILVGILMFAMKSIGDSAKSAETKTALENARGLLAELESKAKLGQSNAPAQWWAATTSGTATLITASTDTTVQADSDIDFWHMTYKGGSPVHPVTIDAPKSVKDGEPDRDGYAVSNTVIAMTKLITIPANRTKIQSIPANRLYKPRFTTPSPKGPNDDSRTNLVDESQAPVLLDGWGNPILFVPAAGMVNVKLSGTTDATGATNLITSSKVRRTNDPNTSQAWANISVDRPFFASAGPDGDFSTGDDNIYSFEQ